MKVMGLLAGAILLAAVAAGGGYFYGKNHVAEKHEPEAAATTQPAEDEKPVVEVEAAPLKRGTITQTITSYGTVIAQPSDIRAVSVPFESRVMRVMVTAGESITAGTEIVEVQASLDALVSLQEAHNAMDAATRDMQQVKQRYDEHLATNQELSQAQLSVSSAKLKLDSLVERGVGQTQRLKANAPGIVTKVDVLEGQIVSAGGPLVEVASGKHVEVRLGVEPGEATILQPGMAITLTRVDHMIEEPIEGKIRLIEQRVDPATRLVEVLVSLPENTKLMLESFIVGQFARSADNAMIVPRAAALPDEDGKFVVYTAIDGKAVQHKVQLGLETDEEVQVIAEDLKQGDTVIVEGNYQLQPGTAVNLKTATTQPTTEGKL